MESINREDGYLHCPKCGRHDGFRVSGEVDSEDKKVEIVSCCCGERLTIEWKKEKE